MASRLVLLTLLASLLGACASRQPGPPGVDVPAPEEFSAETSPLRHINPEVIYYVGAAEILGQREMFAESAEYYRKAAQISDDPQIAARAVKVAAFVDDENLTLDGVQRWIELDAADPEPHRYAAILFLRRGEAARAWEHVEAILQLADTPEAWQAIGKMLAGAPDRAAALQLYRTLIDSPYELPRDVETFRLYSDLAVQLGEVETAEALSTTMLEIDPESAEIHNWRGRLRHSLDRLDDARADFERAVALAPDEESYRQSYAALLAELEEYEAALEQLEQVTGNETIIYSKALYAQAADQPERARQYLAELEALPVDDENRKYFLLGQLSEALERPVEETLAYYRQVQSGDRLDDAKLRSAVVLARTGELAQARTMLRKLQNGNAETASRAYLAEAAILRDGGEGAEAMRIYDRALQFLPEDVDLLFARALHAETMDDIDRAVADLQRVLELRPDDPNALNALGYTLADRTERYDEALTLIERAYEQMPQEAAVVDSLGWVHFKLGNMDLALNYLQQAFELETDPEIAAHLGEVLWQLGRHDEAEAAWREVLSEDPDAEPVLETRRRLGAQ